MIKAAALMKKLGLKKSLDETLRQLIQDGRKSLSYFKQRVV
jgi:hypothetical protein